MNFPLPFAILLLTAPWLSAAEPTKADADFAKAVQPFFDEHCVRCHGEKKQKGEFRIDTLSRDFLGGGSASHWADVMDRISSGEMPPEKEKQPTTAEATKIVEWLAGKLKEGESARLAKRERVTLHKLTRDEYANTIYDLLGVHYDVTDPTGLSEDEEWHGFERIGSVQSLSPSHVEKYFAAAERILAEGLPDKAFKPLSVHRGPTDLRGSAKMVSDPSLLDKVRVDLWPGAELGGRGNPGNIPVPGLYKGRVKLSGLKPANGRAPHLAIYSVDLDRMLFEQDVVAPEDKPIIIEFTTHLPAGNANVRIANETPGPSNLPRSGRAGNKPFFSIKDGRIPWQEKLTDEQDQPILPFLILDYLEWEGPIVEDGPTLTQREYFPKESGNLAQTREVLQKFAERAFRRPVKPEEVDQFATLVESEMKSGEKFDAAMKTALQAVLCSKDFIYLVEGSAETNTQRLNEWELASRLSYFLWSTMPDAELLDAAKRGVLHESATLQAQVRRMLADERAHRFTDAFPRQWLQLRRLGMFPPNKKLYPEYDAYLEKSMAGESTAFFREVLEKNLTLREFLDSNWTMLNARLANHYQVPGVNEDKFIRVALKPEDHRGGLLTEAAILSLTSDGTRDRPVHRGKWVLESIIGRAPPPPPANVKPIEPTPATQPKATLRNKLDAHKSDASCAACHQKIDPYGFAFNNFDAIGRWRTEEVVGDGLGGNPPVDATGELIDGRKFSNAEELKKILVTDLDKFNAAFVEKLATFALRRTTTIDDHDALAKLAQQSKKADYRLPAIVESLVLSDLFQKR